MGKKRISTVKDMRNRINLMLSESYFGIDTDKTHVTAIIFTRANAVELLVIHFCEPFTTLRITPDPICKRLLNEFLLTLCNSRFFLVEYRGLFSVLVLNIIEDADIFKVQRFLHDFIAVYSRSAISVVRFDISTVVGFTFYVPLSGKLCIMNMNIPLTVSRRIEQFKHKVLYNFRWKPSRTKPYGDFTCCQINRLHCLKSTNILSVIFGIKLCASPCNSKFFSYISGKIFISGKVFRTSVIFARVHGI